MDSIPTTVQPRRFVRVAIAIAAIAVGVAAIGGVVAWNWQDVNRGEMDREVTFSFKSTLLAFDSARSVNRIMKTDFPVPNKLDDAGKPLSSWRFQISPYLEFEPRIAGNLKASWEAPENAAARLRTPHNYCFLGDDQPGATTNVFAMTGKGTAMDPDLQPTEETLPPNLIVLMETGDDSTHWMQPGDYDVAKFLESPGVLGDVAKGVRADRIHVAFADAEVWALKADTPVERLRPFLTIDAAKSASRGDLREFQLPMKPTQRN